MSIIENHVKYVYNVDRPLLLDSAPPLLPKMKTESFIFKACLFLVLDHTTLELSSKGPSYTLPTPAGAGHQLTIPTNMGHFESYFS
jgi:hypothetical protein